jgi:hypothetical protein
MISLSLPNWFVALLLVHLAVVFAATLFYAVRRVRWTARRRAAPFIFRCSVCGHVYLDRRNVPMSECEKCGNMNESVKSVV